jgi:hypothetical protein
MEALIAHAVTLGAALDRADWGSLPGNLETDPRPNHDLLLRGQVYGVEIEAWPQIVDSALEYAFHEVGAEIEVFAFRIEIDGNLTHRDGTPIDNDPRSLWEACAAAMLASY